MPTNDENSPYDHLHVKVSSPTGVHLEEDAHSLTAVNDTGEFDVLPGHRDFITLLNPCELRVETVKGAIKKLDITSGILHVEDNRASVFLNIL